MAYLPTLQRYKLKSLETAVLPFTYCIRKPNVNRRTNEKSNYKKGHEIRISLNNIEETRIMKELFKKKAIIAGNPYKRHDKIILPIYGKENVIKVLNRIVKSN
jgi:hypothetical protein